VRRDEKALADILSSAIQGAIDDGSVAILAKRWFGFDASAR
jgi:ABC-type amino acid transport substrate-binding protein